MHTSRTAAHRTTLRTCRLIVSAAALIFACSASRAPLAHADDEHDVVPPAVPANLQVPAGNSPFLVGHADGTQDYICLPSGAGFAWTFFGPQATLLDDEDEQIITHFLSPNPVESGKPRPTWQNSHDTSTVWGNAVATATSASDPTFVAAGAIPWLLLQVVGTQSGPTNGDRLTATTFIQRLNTSGGVAPAAGCAASTDVGTKALVHYTANYFFYKPDQTAHRKGHHND
jgi:Protein of unknown function (DUF3455)